MSEQQQHSFAPLSSETAAYVADLYASYQRDSASVGENWRRFFEELDSDARSMLERLSGRRDEAAAAPGGDGIGAVAAGVAHGEHLTAEHIRRATLDSIRALMLIRAYRVRGHLEADLDPLGLRPREPHPELDPSRYGFGDGDWERPIFVNHVLGLETATLSRIMERLRATYCGKIGVEYMHMQEPDQKQWIQERIENIDNRTDFSTTGKRAILERLTAAEAFERFLDKKYTGTKRFGIDGAEAMVPALEQILKRGGHMGLEEVVIGMPHRGRLNVLANFMGKPFQAIFSEFEGGAAHPEDVGGSGDVKYHLGTSSDREFDGNDVHLSLTANPSHLEAVDPVVVGKVRAKQMQRGDTDRTQVAGLLLHGDAAFAGQGLVPETLDLSELKGYRIGGTVHFIINNQIGFTTNPAAARSSPYCTDVAKMIQAPIFHVNGDDPEAVVHVARIATEFRQTFKKDVVIDMFCYRRHGHNEADEPAFTQPLMYDAIRSHPRVRELYGRRLAEEQVVGEDEPDQLLQGWFDRLEQEFQAAKTYKPNKADWLEGVWSGLSAPRGFAPRRGETAVDMDTLRTVGAALTHVPEDFNVNRKIVRQLEAKRKILEAGEGIDWATAEALAFGTLLAEGHPVRLSGQDSARGTFSQRHSVLIDQKDERQYIPLNNIDPDQAAYEVVNSPLSEVGVLGFEYGFSLAEPRALVMWEAQFGDFANGAQVIIDQFVASGEAKWLRMSGLVMLLPHGFEGQGPEHSSARLERFLQLCAEDNLQVVNLTTPAQYFHALRRQLHRDFRKPLVVMTPKSLLRHKRCVSKLADMGPASSFHRVLYCDELPSKPEKARQVVLCSGKIYYDLLEERERRGAEEVHFLRLEQLYPFPADALIAELEPYKHCELVWCQEEPRNMGAWTLVNEFLEEIAIEAGLDKPRPRYAGRKAAASPATGSHERHVSEQRGLLDEALTVGIPRVSRIQTRKIEEAQRTGKRAAPPAASGSRAKAKGGGKRRGKAPAKGETPAKDKVQAARKAASGKAPAKPAKAKPAKKGAAKAPARSSAKTGGARRSAAARSGEAKRRSAPRTGGRGRKR